MTKAANERDGVCPFIDLNDARCDVRFSLSRLDQAFHVCMNGGYVRCPTYFRLAGYAPGPVPAGYGAPGYTASAEGPSRDADRDYTIRLTVHGRTLSRTGGRSELRPTGS